MSGFSGGKWHNNLTGHTMQANHEQPASGSKLQGPKQNVSVTKQPKRQYSSSVVAKAIAMHGDKTSNFGPKHGPFGQRQMPKH